MTSTTATPGRPLPGWLKTGLLAALVFALCWAAAIAWWHTADSEPGASDLVLMLLALPCGLLLVFKLGKRLVPARPAVPAAAAARPAPGQAAPAPSAPPLAILAAALRSPHGASPEELGAAIAENKARPDLDPELVDDKGFPVTAARRGDAADAASQEEISDWLAANSLPDAHFSDVQRRALTLGTAVVRDLAGYAASELLPIEGQPPALRLIPLLPVGWTTEQQSSASAWFKHVTAQFGWPPASVTCAEVPGATGSAPSALLNQFAFRASSGSRFAALVVACESNIDQENIDRWESDGVLFTPARLQGLIPGEGAAGLLLMDLDSIKSQPGSVYALLDPFVETRRDVSIDENKRTDMKPLAGLVERACKQAAIEIADVEMIVADTGERANRTLELMGLASAALPQLESSSDVACVGASSGTCGAVPYLTALALAQHHALERTAPVLCMSNEDAHHCCATLVRPASSRS